MLEDVSEFSEKIARGACYAKQMRHLTDDGHINKSFNEATHHRRGNECGQPAHPHDAEKKEKNADQDSEGGGKRVVLRGALSCESAHGQRGNQAGAGSGPTTGFR